ncbi:MAG: hypothetical protein E6Q97_16080 [Desulfurellales bacterium]|nr:MAG: hypothetical protein E6Q97_16080 [Desulfurellales bacterium]
MVKLKLGQGLRLKPKAKPESESPPDPGQAVSETLRRFKERAKAEDQRFVDNTDSEFWIAIGFQNRAQKEEFLQKTGISRLGDKYLDGMAVAALLGVELTTPIPKIPKLQVPRKLLRLVR